MTHDQFKAYIDDLIARCALRGDTLTACCRFVLEYSGRFDWLRDFQWLLFMPRFLNVAFVAGSCNADCRMCSAGRGEAFQYVKENEILKMTAHAPTADTIILSARTSEPLMNPEMPAILDALGARGVRIGFFTNGLALTRALAEKIVATQAVETINFSLDAASAETYRRIRRRDLSRVLDHIAYLVDCKRRARVRFPMLSVSMVEMEDNIAELSDLVRYAVSIDAYRVYVEALNNPGGENQSAMEHPGWEKAVAEAQRIALAAGVRLQLPAKLASAARVVAWQNAAPTPAPESQFVDSTLAANTPEADAESQALRHAERAPDNRLPCCTWLRGVWIELDGTMWPCCVNAGTTIGNIYDGLLWENMEFLIGKMKLFGGRVFPSCYEHIHACKYLSEAEERGEDIRRLSL